MSDDMISLEEWREGYREMCVIASQKESEITAQDATIATLRAELATAQATIAERDREIVWRDATITELEGCFLDAERTMITGFEEEMLKSERVGARTERDAALARETALREALNAVDSAILVRFKPTDHWYQGVIEPILNGVLGPDAQPPAAAALERREAEQRGLERSALMFVCEIAELEAKTMLPNVVVSEARKFKAALAALDAPKEPA